MKRLFVIPDYRGKGVGRELSARIIKERKQIGYSRMRLDTVPSMLKAHFLYESLGFLIKFIKNTL